tara:strand:+ start:791 stop:1309 length:519 start_codon:yes stop_codon:yes gene_type:complete
MSKQQPIEIITPPNMLRVKVGGRVGPIDEAAIARAEAALDDMSGDFAQWLEQEVVKLEAAAKGVMESGVDSEAGETLFNVAHDLRGLGTTYNFPIITRMSASLCKMIETEEKRASAPAALAVAHAHGIRAALRQNIRTTDDQVGRILLQELENQVAEFAAPWEDQPAMRAAG